MKVLLNDDFSSKIDYSKAVEVNDVIIILNTGVKLIINRHITDKNVVNVNLSGHKGKAAITLDASNQFQIVTEGYKCEGSDKEKEED